MATLDAVHDKLETDVKCWLENNGFYVPPPPTYHESWPKEMANAITKRYSLTALYLRGRADRCAIHKTLPFEFEWEAKTTKKYPNLAIEALPLCHHLSKAERGVKCIYVCRDCREVPRDFPNRGFVASAGDLPPIADISIPSRWNAATRNEFRRIFEKWFPGVPIHDNDYSNGSGDPWVRILSADFNCLPDWKDLILDEMNYAKAYEGV